jgi:hypothetical protein
MKSKANKKKATMPVGSGDLLGHTVEVLDKRGIIVAEIVITPNGPLAKGSEKILMTACDVMECLSKTLGRKLSSRKRLCKCHHALGKPSKTRHRHAGLEKKNNTGLPSKPAKTHNPLSK